MKMTEEGKNKRGQFLQFALNRCQTEKEKEEVLSWFENPEMLPVINAMSEGWK